jgi:hypothetical protein
MTQSPAQKGKVEDNRRKTSIEKDKSELIISFQNKQGMNSVWHKSMRGRGKIHGS